MEYSQYQNARDAAWHILCDCQIARLPVNLNIICKKLGIKTLRYEKAKILIEANHLEEIVKQTDGFTYFQGGTPVILYDGNIYPPRIRFTVAHEIGHIVLGHIGPASISRQNAEPQNGDHSIETAANQFAARILAPACVLWALDIHTPEEIEDLCHISHQAAVFRAARMKELYKRQKFLASPLERKVFAQFSEFIQEHRGRHPV